MIWPFPQGDTAGQTGLGTAWANDPIRESGRYLDEPAIHDVAYSASPVL